MAKRKRRRTAPPPKDSPPPKDEAAPDLPDAPAPPAATPPPTETPPPEPFTPDPEPISIDASEKNRKLDRLFWMRIALATIAGISATFIFEPLEGEERRWASIGYMVVLFLGTIFVAKAMRIPLPAADRKKVVTQAIASYVFVYLFVWILTTTIVHALSNGSGPTPLV